MVHLFVLQSAVESKVCRACSCCVHDLHVQSSELCKCFLAIVAVDVEEIVQRVRENVSKRGLDFTHLEFDSNPSLRSPRKSGIFWLEKITKAPVLSSSRLVVVKKC